MERKIGEIFEYNGEWYQCMEQPEKYDKTVCALCAFQGNGNCELDRCSGTYRSDKKSVIFKKLEKVGEPYVKRVSDGTFSTFQRYRVYNSVILPKEPYIYCNFIDSTIEIEVKQTKEYMEEKKQQADKLVTDYTDNKITYKEFEKSIIELYADKHTEEKKLNLKEFDLEAAKAGKPVCTRDGRKARIICFDRVNAKPILALIASTDGKGEDVFDYFVSGKRTANALESDLDLMMLPDKRSGWAKVRKDINLYDTKEEADRKMIGNDEYVTAKVFWEE